MPALKFPGRTLFLHPAVFLFPAGDGVFVSSSVIADEVENLTFNVGGNRSPALLVAMNGLERYSEQFRHLFLCFSKLFPGSCKFLGIQWVLLVIDNSYQTQIYYRCLFLTR